jgi:C-5 cytosine-specific DNA methylase
MSQPLAIDLFCGLGGWTEGLLAEGYYVVGFDIERHEYGEHSYPGQLVIQDVLTLHGSQFKDAALIVASPPCQAYSYRAMPWKHAKALPPPDNSLFEACFRIQREASEAAGDHIPMVVENVKGAQKWVGRSRWNFGSFHLWGDVPALMPMTAQLSVTKNKGGSWFRVSHNNVPHSRGDHTPHMTNPDEHRGVKHQASGRVWFDGGPAAFPSNSLRRKAASAMISKIPLPLARHIAKVYHP